jgi:long-chain acyl-CoA synthetase
MSGMSGCLTAANDDAPQHEAAGDVGARVAGETLVELLLRRIAQSPDGLAILAHQRGTWRRFTWQQFGDDVLRTCGALQRLGVRPGDRVVQLSENRYEWIVTDLAIQFAAAVHVPIHATLAGPQIIEQIADCQPRLAIVSSGEQARKLSCGGAIVDSLAIWSHDAAHEALPGKEIRPLQDVVAEISEPSPAVEWEARNRVVADDVATIIYTSGTTGEPKGAMLTHANLCSNALGTLAEFDFCATDIRLGFLPLSHVFARTCDLYCGIACGAALAIARSRESVLDDCRALRPTMINGVPYFFEKVMRAVAEHGGELADYFGGRIRYACSGGAALPDHVATFYAARGIALVQGYGLTETSPVMTISTPDCHRTGTVGRAIRGVELRIARDGEILTRGPHVMRGYWNRPEATAEILREGWLHTGDLGEIDDDGFLRITGRKKEIIVTAAGKNVAPVRIETLLTEDPAIAQAVVFGDGRSYLAALIVPDFAVLERELPSDGRDDVESHEKKNEAVRQLLSARIAQRLACLSHHEQVRRFAILPQAFTVEAGELTPTLKLRREVIARRYANQIAALYQAG